MNSLQLHVVSWLFSTAHFSQRTIPSLVLHVACVSLLPWTVSCTLLSVPVTPPLPASLHPSILRLISPQPSLSCLAHPLTALYLGNSNCSSISVLPESRWRISSFCAITHQNGDTLSTLPKLSSTTSGKSRCALAAFGWSTYTCVGRLQPVQATWLAGPEHTLCLWTSQKILFAAFSWPSLHRDFLRPYNLARSVHILCKAEVRCSSEAKPLVQILFCTLASLGLCHYYSSSSLKFLFHGQKC